MSSKDVKKDDPEKKHCTCKICEYGRDISKLAERQATPEDRAMIEKLFDRMFGAEEDADYWRIFAHGGFENVNKTLFDKEYVKKFYDRKKE